MSKLIIDESKMLPAEARLLEANPALGNFLLEADDLGLARQATFLVCVAMEGQPLLERIRVSQVRGFLPK